MVSTTAMSRTSSGSGGIDRSSFGHVVTGLDVRVARRAYASPFRISGGGTDDLTSVLVRLRIGPPRPAAAHTGPDSAADCSCHGVGETTPMTAYSGETTAGLVDVIEGVLAPAVIGCKAFDLAGLHARMDEAIRGRPVAKAAVDLAMVDAQASLLGLPASMLLGGRVRDEVEIAWVIGLGDVDAMVAEAVRQAGMGFWHIKVKGGVDPDLDVRLVTEVVQAVPAGTQVALDANGGYDVRTAIQTLLAMQRAGLAQVEQPVPGWDVGGMKRLTRMLEIPVMADESLQSIHDAHLLACEGACDIMNIKLLKVGGLYRARQVAAVAEAAGIPVKVGSMPELGVATLAGLHFAAATPGARIPADLVGPLMVSDDIVTDPDLAGQGAHGRLPVPTTPGLGGNLDCAFDSAVAPRTEQAPR